ncbi:MAG: hypothetical protein JXR22_02275, partial [Prolixibacteraceae bacterium]|nr:hypothetical protein [Prolixibacteraceae bacterium]
MHNVKCRVFLLILIFISLTFPVRSNNTFSFKNVTEIPLPELEVLVMLYYQTNGDAWLNKRNWLESN